MPWGSKASLMRRISRDLHRVLELEEVRLLLDADAVLARDGPADGHRRLGDQAAEQLGPRLGVGLEDRQVDVAVTRRGRSR